MVIIKSPKIKLVYVSVAGSKENLHKHNKAKAEKQPNKTAKNILRDFDNI